MAFSEQRSLSKTDAMNSGMSSLNPYAASYIPISKRGAAHRPGASDLAVKDTKYSDENIFSGPSSGHVYSEPSSFSGPSSGHIFENQYQNKASYGFSFNDTKHLPVEGFIRSGQPEPGYHVSSLKTKKEVTENQIVDELFEIDLAYLQMTFPGVSEQSLVDVYLANDYDLDATIDMLSQLEPMIMESHVNHPQNRNSHGVSSPGSSSSRAAALKFMEPTGDSSSSSAGSTGASFLP